MSQRFTKEDLEKNGWRKGPNGEWIKNSIVAYDPNPKPVSDKVHSGNQNVTAGGEIFQQRGISSSSTLCPIFSESKTTDEEKLNKTEKRFLEILRRDVKQVWIGIQCVTLKLAHDCRYTPDFVSIDASGQMIFWEVKGGHIWEDSTIKTKTAARMFRWAKFVRAQLKKDKWTETEFKP